MAKMTPAELRAEMDYRITERLALLGCYDARQTPEWAARAATAEAERWAERNEPAAWKELKT